MSPRLRQTCQPGLSRDSAYSAQYAPIGGLGDASRSARSAMMTLQSRVHAQEGTAGDLLEFVRSNGKQRYELGEAEGCKYIRAMQGNTRK